MLRRCSSRTILTATSLDLGAAHDGREAGHAAVHELNAPGAKLDVVNRAVQRPAPLPLPAAHIGAGELPPPA